MAITVGLKRANYLAQRTPTPAAIAFFLAHL